MSEEGKKRGCSILVLPHRMCPEMWLPQNHACAARFDRHDAAKISLRHGSFITGLCDDVSHAECPCGRDQRFPILPGTRKETEVCLSRFNDDVIRYGKDAV